jgi:Tol biopolymer transport system component
MTPERWQQIEQVFHQALTLPPNQRPAFLDQACGADAEMRREVELMIEADEDTGFLKLPAAAKVTAEPVAGLDSSLIGKQLSHYNILSRIGAGGMGDVYAAQDTRLRRKVALKILPARFTQDPDRLQRFEREAMAAAMLNHQNIVTVHEIAEVEGIHFIAAEFVEGVTLRERLNRGKLELNEALDISVQITKALEAAHSTGIVHRDIKPENLMIRPDGVVKVLDFGIAKLTEPPASAANDQAASRTTNITEQGMIIGTPRYMSPEQARGQKVDARSDIFSFGDVIYEMLTGQPPFGGETATDLFVEILDREPTPLSRLAPEAPDEVERIVGKALAKNNRERYQTIGELRLDLQAFWQEFALQPQFARARQRKPRGRTTRGQVKEQSPQPFSRIIRWGVLTVGLLAIVIVSSAVWRRFFIEPPPQAPPDQRITRLVNEGIKFGEGISSASFSRDGKWIAYSLSDESGNSIWVRQVGGGNPKQITEGKWRDRDPVWSHDGQYLAFISEREGKRGIWSIPVWEEGRSPSPVKEINLVNGTLTDWSDDAKTIYYESNANLYTLDLVSVYELNAKRTSHRASGQATRLTDFDPHIGIARDFSISPDKNQVAYSYLDSSGGKSHIFVRSVRGGKPKQITYGDGEDRYPNWFPDGKTIAYSSNSSGIYQIYLARLDSDKTIRVTSNVTHHESVAASPDGNKIISILKKEMGNIFSCDIVNHREDKHTDKGLLIRWPEVSPDGKWIAFQSSDANLSAANETIIIKPIKDSEQPIEIPVTGFEAKWSPAGGWLASLREVSGKSEIWKVSDSGRNKEQLTTGIKFVGTTGLPYNRLATNYDWSPDGKKIAYSSTKSGYQNLWVVSADRLRGDGWNDELVTGNRDQTLKLSSPVWAPDGKRIAYVSEKLASSVSEWAINVCVIGQEKPEIVFRSEMPLRIIGWSRSGQEIYVASGERKSHTYPQQVSLHRVSVGREKHERIALISAAYLHNIKLSLDRRKIALVSRQDGKDNIKVIPASGGLAKKITDNSDPTVHYASLAWTPDGRRLFFSKQTSWSEIIMIENFR